MKNATKYVEALRGLIKSLSRESRPAQLVKMEPLAAFVRGSLSYDVPDSRADEAVRAINREFVNLNELRVATELELQDLIGPRYPAVEERVAMMTACLNAIFEKEHTLSLDRLRAISKKDARQFLRELPLMHPFVEAYVMMYALESPCMPMDQETLAYLREEREVFDEKTTIEDAQRFIENNFKGEECYELFVGLRRAVYGESGRSKKKNR